MKQKELRKNNPVLFLFMIFCISNLCAQTSIELEKHIKKEGCIYIKAVCDKNEKARDTLNLDSFKDYDTKIFKKNTFYFLWKGKTSLADTYYLNKHTIDSNCQFKYHKANWCKQEFFDKELKEGKYMKFTRKGIAILFKDGSKKEITFEELEKDNLQDILKR